MRRSELDNFYLEWSESDTFLIVIIPGTSQPSSLVPHFLKSIIWDSKHALSSIFGYWRNIKSPEPDFFSEFQMTPKLRPKKYFKKALKNYLEILYALPPSSYDLHLYVLCKLESLFPLLQIHWNEIEKLILRRYGSVFGITNL